MGSQGSIECVAKGAKRNTKTHGPLKFLDPETSVVFLALTWFGPRALSLDILESFDSAKPTLRGRRPQNLTYPELTV
jgi:hypothetical protein